MIYPHPSLSPHLFLQAFICISKNRHVMTKESYFRRSPEFPLSTAVHCTKKFLCWPSLILIQVLFFMSPTSDVFLFWLKCKPWWILNVPSSYLNDIRSRERETLGLLIRHICRHMPQMCGSWDGGLWCNEQIDQRWVWQIRRYAVHPRRSHRVTLPHPSYPLPGTLDPSYPLLS